MTPEDIVTRVTRSFGDESAVQINEDDILRWINDAQREVVIHNETVFAATTTQDIVQGQNSYTLPVDLYVLRSIRLKLPDMLSYTHIKFFNLQEFDRMVEGWDGTLRGEGLPFIYTTYARELFLFPTPERDSTDGLKVLYSQRPTELASISDPISLPIEYHNAIVKYCMHQAQIVDEDLEASAVHQAAFLGDVQQLSFQAQRGAQETYPTITTLPDDMW